MEHTGQFRTARFVGRAGLLPFRLAEGTSYNNVVSHVRTPDGEPRGALEMLKT